MFTALRTSLDCSFFDSRTPPGAPASDADVGFLMPGNRISVRRDHLQSTSGAIVRSTGANGQIDVPPDNAIEGIVVHHPTGFAELSREQFEANSNVSLRPWATVEGILTDGSAPIPNRLLCLRFADNKTPLSLFLSAFRTKTDAQGRFTFQSVPPGKLELIVLSEGERPDGGKVWTHKANVPIDIQPGANRRLQVQLIQGESKWDQSLRLIGPGTMENQ